MRNRKLRVKKFLSQIKKIYGDSISFPDLDYRNNRTRVNVKCSIHNTIYTAWPCNLISGRRGCTKCCGNLTQEDFIEKSIDVHGFKYNYDKVKFVNTTTPVTITCPIHGDWDTKPITHYHNGSKCPKCAPFDRRLSTDEFIDKARQVHGNKYGYDKVVLDTIQATVEIKCPTHGYFKQPARAHLAGHNCKKCGILSTKNTLEEFITTANKIHGNTYDYSRAVYVNSKTKLTVVCKYHGEFYVRPNSHIANKSGCPRCRESYGERMIAHYLDQFGITFKKEYSFKGSRYRFDFYLPKHNVLIEFHGIQHYEPVDRFGGWDNHLCTVRNDVVKVKFAVENNMHLLVFNYKDLSGNKLFDNLKKELINLNIISA
jgi:hypothetical protein